MSAPDTWEGTRAAWITDDNAALLTDLYQLTMLQAYWHERMFGPAVFSLFVRRLPPSRNFLLACGLDDVLRYLEHFRFDDDALAFLARRPEFDADFIDWLASLRFTGDVRALREGTPFFANEPILEVSAPLPEAQIIETFVMNQITVQTVLASKAARVVEAAAGRRVVDFGLRRMHGTDAGMKAARAFHVAGVAATSNVLAGRVYDVPIIGTMAHSYIQSHETELDAFRAFVKRQPRTTLLVDTYDTIEGVRNVVRLAGELGDAFQVRAIRLDSGNLIALALEARRILDEAGLAQVEIFATSGLDEREIEGIVQAGAPIDGFGVGTGMGVSADAPALDLVYKLTEYSGRARLKLSRGKPILPGAKQVFREEKGGVAVRDVIARAEEEAPGRPLLVPVMRAGKRLPEGGVALNDARAHARDEIRSLPASLRTLLPAEPPYPVTISDALQRLHDQEAARTRWKMESVK